jgi:hypothetical protein
MNVDVSTDVVIDCPLSTVSGYASDPDNVPEWYVNIKSVEWKTARAVNVGARVAFVAQFLGRRLAYTYEIVEFIPGERLVMRSADGPFPMETTYTWQPLGTRSYSDDASESRNADRFLRVGRTFYGLRHATCKSKGSGTPQGIARKRWRRGSIAGA